MIGQKINDSRIGSSALGRLSHPDPQSPICYRFDAAVFRPRDDSNLNTHPMATGFSYQPDTFPLAFDLS